MLIESMVELVNRLLGGLEVSLRAFCEGLRRKAVAVRHALLWYWRGFQRGLLSDMRLLSLDNNLKHLYTTTTIRYRYLNINTQSLYTIKGRTLLD